MWERSLVIEHLGEIAQVDPAAAEGASLEVLGFFADGPIDAAADVFAAGESAGPTDGFAPLPKR